VWASPEKTFGSRMRFYLSYMAMAALAGALVREPGGGGGRYNLVYATSPPLFVGLAGLAAATARRVPFVFEVRDLWPESAVALGELADRRAIALAEGLERLLYRRAKRIVAVTSGIRDRLVQRGIPEGKLALIPNGANTDLFRFDPDGRQRVRAQWGVHEDEDQFVAMYAGVHGLAQGLETVLQAASMLKDRPHIRFVFVGEGPRKAGLVDMSRRMGLSNVRFLPEVPAHQMPAYLSAADCTIVPLRDQPVFRGALPSKMFEAWACARPVVLSAAGEAVGVLNEAGGGIAVPPERPDELARAILHLAEHADEAGRMGLLGCEYVRRNYSRQEQASRLEALLRSLMDEHQPEPERRPTCIYSI
jgi:glycosyltransferase involved in cell wall biosynthesis